MSGQRKITPLFPASRTEDPGRMLFVEDIQELFGTKKDGSFRKSRWWVTHKFFPEGKKKAGRDCYWFEKDVQRHVGKVAA